MEKARTDLAVIPSQQVRVSSGRESTKPINLTVAVVDREKLLSRELHEAMDMYVVGQDEAKKAIVSTVIRGMFNVNREQGVIGAVFLAGPTGVGKTEMARTLSRVFFGTPDGITKIPCETMPHPADIARLVGSSAGYLGYGDTPHLADKRVHDGYKTAKEKKRLHPLIQGYEMENFSIVLVDECEKSHPDIMNAFLGAIQTGEMQMCSGKESSGSKKTDIEHSLTTDLRNTLFIFTSNVGEHVIDVGKTSSMGFTKTSQNANSKADDAVFMKEYKKHFSPPFRGRMDALVRCHAISDSDLLKILDINVAHINRILANKGYYDSIRVATSRKYVEHVFAVAKKDNDYGARAINGIINTIGSHVGLALQSGMLPGDANGVIEFDMLGKDLDIRFVPTPGYLSDIVSAANRPGGNVTSRESVRDLIEGRIVQHGEDIRNTITEYALMFMDYEPGLKQPLRVLEKRLREAYGFTDEDLSFIQTSTFLEAYESLDKTDDCEIIVRNGAKFDPVGFRAIEKYLRVAVLKGYSLKQIYHTVRVLLNRPMSADETTVVSHHIHQLLQSKKPQG